MVRRRAGSQHSIVDLARQLRMVKDQRSLLNKRYDEVRNRLMDVLDEEGVEDDKGSLVLTLPEEVDGVLRLVKQRKVSPSLDEDALEEYLEEKGLRDEAISTREFLDKDKVARLIFEGRLTEAEFAKFVQEKVTWALQEEK